MGWLIVAVLLFGFVVLYLSATAGRLDRLHHRVEAGREALRTQLRRRAEITLAIANSGLLDPASSLVLADAAAGALEESDPLVAGQAESDFSAALAAVFGSGDDVAELVADSVGRDLVEDLTGACHKVDMSRRFYNDSVRACIQVRRQLLVRLFRLAGHASWPVMAEFDAVVPEGFEGR